jgi:hypothetical protein
MAFDGLDHVEQAREQGFVGGVLFFAFGPTEDESVCAVAQEVDAGSTVGCAVFEFVEWT